MKVLYITTRPYVADGAGGIFEFFGNVIPGLKKIGVDITLYAGDKRLKKLAGPFNLEGVSFYNGPYPKPGLFTGLFNLGPAIQLCQELKFDLIHAHTMYASEFLAYQLQRRLSIPYVLTSHSEISPVNSMRLNKTHVRKRYQKIMQDAKAITHLAPHMADISNELLTTRNKDIVIGNGINVSLWQKYHDLPEKKYLLSLGRFDIGKGFDVLIKMYKQLIDQGFTAPLILAGDGKLKSALLQQCTDLGIRYTDKLCLKQLPERTIIFPGYIRADLKHRLISQSLLVYFATQPELWEEAFGIVQLEAMAAGKPLIASNTKITNYLQSQGMQVSIAEPKNIEEWVKYTLEITQNDILRKEMCEKNKICVKQFDWKIIAEQYREFYTSLLK